MFVKLYFFECALPHQKPTLAAADRYLYYISDDATFRPCTVVTTHYAYSRLVLARNNKSKKKNIYVIILRDPILNDIWTDN